MACGGRQVRARCDWNCKARHRQRGEQGSWTEAGTPRGSGEQAPGKAAVEGGGEVGRGKAAFRGCWCAPASGRHRGCGGGVPGRCLSFPLGAGRHPSPGTPDHIHGEPRPGGPGWSPGPL